MGPTLATGGRQIFSEAVGFRVWELKFFARLKYMHFKNFGGWELENDKFVTEKICHSRVNKEHSHNSNKV